MKTGVWLKAIITQCSNTKDYWYADKVGSIVEIKKHTDSSWGVEERSTLGQVAPHDFQLMTPHALKDVLPSDAQIYNSKIETWLDIPVVMEYNRTDNKNFKNWPGTHKNVHCWWLLSNGYAVGWNENPSLGYSFPFVKLYHW